MPDSASERTPHEQQLDALIAEYLQAADEGRPLDKAKFLSLHPEFAAELREFFADDVQIKKFAPPPTPNPEETLSFPGSSSTPRRPGTKVPYFGDYEILEELGVGGMGVVYKARQTKLNKIIALKMIKVGHLAGDDEVRQFQAEARAAAKLDHPGIVPVHEVGVDHGQHYYTMDYVGGGSLSKLHREEPVAARRAAEIIKQMAEAMHYAHGQGIVHRDLKPANVLLTAGGAPRITDFGLAKRLWHGDDSADVAMTQTGAVMGTAGYMSPEQAAGKTKLVGPPADIYALGAVLYALLTSRAPFVGESQADTILQVIQKEPVSPRVLNPSIARDLETICLKCLEKEPHKRYGTAQLLADDLSRFLANRPVLARPVSGLDRIWRWGRRNPALAALGIVLVIVTSSGLAVRHNILAERERVQRENLEQHNLTRAQGLVDALVNAATPQVPAVIRDLAEYRRWADPLLRRESAKAKGGSREKLHLALALLPVDELQVPYLHDHLLVVTPSQFPIVRDALLPQREQLVEPLWKVALDTSQPIQPRFQAACALASYAPKDKRWGKVDKLVTGHLVTRQTSDLVAWRESLRPAKNQLIKSLGMIYRDKAQREQPRVYATETLSDYAADQPAVLVDLLADAEQFQYPVIFEKLSPEKSIPLAAAELAKQTAKDASEDDKEILAKRQANAAVVLVRLGAAEQAWPLLKYTPDPRARSYFIHWFRPLGGNPKSIIKRLDSEPDVSIRRALLLTLGEFDEPQLPLPERQPLIEKLMALYETDPEAGLHAAAEWVLRKWGEGNKLQAVLEKLRTNPKQRSGPQAGESRKWYVNSQGQTMVVLKGGEFTMGSPEFDEQSNKSIEGPHQQKISRGFAMAAHEVTVAQFGKFKAERPEIHKDHSNLNQWVKTDDSPRTGITWYEAAAYCNWLSAKDGLTEDQWCYEPNAQNQYAAGMKAKPKVGELLGYRLPSEAEWEYACRAGSITSRYYGSSERLLSEYAWYYADSQARVWPVGGLKPNDFGLFDMLGNAWEWLHDPFQEFARSWDWPLSVSLDESPVSDSKRRLERGGSYNSRPGSVRSADRSPVHPDGRWSGTGFRVARTYAATESQTHSEEVALQVKGLEEAVVSYRRDVELDPNNALAYNRLGNFLSDREHYAEAIVVYRKSIDLDPKLAAAHSNLGLALYKKRLLDEAIASCRKAIDLDPKLAAAHSNLGLALKDKGLVDEAIVTYRKAIELGSNNAADFNNLGGLLCERKHDYDGAIVAYLKSIELDPIDAKKRCNLGSVLLKEGKLDEAVASHQKAIELDSNYADAYNNLGSVLYKQGKLDEAFASLKKAIELDPKHALAHNNLGNVLREQRKIGQAVASYQKAIELDPNYAKAHLNLGCMLSNQGKLDEAVASLKKATELDPKYALAHNNLGVTLLKQGKLDQAVASYQKAIELDPRNANAHNDLGVVLLKQGKLDEAIACYQEAIEVDPKMAKAHCNIGAMLARKGQMDDAIACFKKAVELDPKMAEAHTNLGIEFLKQGKLDEAVVSLQKAIETDPKGALARARLAEAERMAAARDKLPAFQNGSYTPASNAERLSLAEWCQMKKLLHTATGLYSAAFVADPKLAADLQAGHRYNAACYAALAAAGQGQDAAKLNGQERTRLRQQARGWLRADLALHTKWLETDKPTDRAAVQQVMRHWQKDTDLAGVREEAELAKLPADEQEAFTQLWADVAALLAKAEEKPK